MERLIYKEEQSFRQSFIPWIMLSAIILAMGGMGVDFYQQFFLAKSSGNESANSQGMIWSSILAFIIMGTAFVFILNGNLTTEIWTDGIRYRFPPFIQKMRHIPLTEIVSVEVGKYKPLAEFGGWGVRRRILSGKTAYNVSGRFGMQIRKKNGRQVMFGTRKQDEIKRAVDKMLQPEMHKYSI